jgi:hypothetical protein
MATLTETLNIGSFINNNRYQIVEKLGYGSEADVFLVKDKNEHDMEYFIIY